MRTVKNALFVTAAATALGGLGAALAPERAEACGGFFCARTPIDQSGEYILFSMEPDRVRAYIQIQYQGKADDFAWVVPVMSVPTRISVGVQQVFTTLMNATLPQFRLDWGMNTGASCFLQPRSASAAGPPAAGAADSSVMVIDQGEVGPYTYVVVSAAEAAKLRQWLDMNGFVQPPSAEPALMHYVRQGFVFVAIKLKRGAETGEIQPLVLEMGHSEACVPLVLTRIAAVPDMPIYTLVLGKHRAAPRNWFQVEINPKRLNWFQNGNNYRRLVTDAVNEAAGRGFVTEFAGATSRFRGALWAPGRYDLSRLQPYIADPILFVRTMLSIGLPRDPIIQSLLRKYIPMPDSVRQRGVSEAAFYNNLAAYQRDLAGRPFDGAAFIRELDMRIVQPLREAQEMVDQQPYLTRLFSTVSPDEMTRDPLFDFNPDLAPVSNIHTARATGMCGADGRVTNVTLMFENGEKQTIPDAFVPWAGPPNMNYALMEPATYQIQLIGPAGPPIPILRSRVPAIDQQLDTLDPKIVRQMAIEQNAAGGTGATMMPGTSKPGTTTGPMMPGETKLADSSGCAVAGGAGAGAAAAPGAGLALLALVLAVGRRRRGR
jgi:hypothetical protein